MEKRYSFSVASFRRTFLCSMTFAYVGIQLLLQIGVWLSNKWNPVSAFLIAIIVGAFCAGLYIKQKCMWKHSYVAINGSSIVYFRKLKDGFEDSAYEFDERTSVLCDITNVTVLRNHIVVEGNIEEWIRKNPKSNVVVKRYVRNVKIRRYLENENELIQSLIQRIR